MSVMRITSMEDHENMAIMPVPPRESDQQLLWKRAEKTLRGLISDEEVEDWFEDTQILECLQDCVILGVPSNFRREYIEQHHYGVLSQTFTNLLQRPVDVEIQLSGPLTGQPEERSRESAPATTRGCRPGLDEAA